MFALATLLARPPADAASAFHVPSWLRLESGTVVRVAQAPWPVEGSEAALTGSEDTAKTDPDNFTSRPGDVVHERAGLKVTIEDIYDDRVVLVRPIGVPWDAYTRIDFLQPNVPIGTDLVVGGGFGKYTYFYPQLDTPTSQALELPNGIPLVSLDESVAQPGRGSDDLVRLKVLVRGGPSRGRVGWVPVNYTGLPLHGAAPASTAERECSCRLLEFR